jgi:hypothetical protein
MTVIRHEHRDLTVACELDSADLKTRVGEWQTLRDDHGRGAEAIPGGGRLWLSSDAVSIAADLIQRESRCCGFLDFEMVVQAERLRLQITSLSPHGARVAAFLAGLDPDPVLVCS